MKTLKRNSKTKKFLLDVWSFKNRRPAFVFEIESKHNSTFLERIKNPGLMLDYQISYIKQRAEIRDDFLPDHGICINPMKVIEI